MYFKSHKDYVPDGLGHSYAANKDVVWHIAVPQNYALLLLLKAIDLEPPMDGGCINDFVSYYVDDEVPMKYCSSVDKIEVIKIISRKFTFRFKSNHANNTGGFYAGVMLLHKESEFVRNTISLNSCNTRECVACYDVFFFFSSSRESQERH